jgi:hypothetical protein
MGPRLLLAVALAAAPGLSGCLPNYYVVTRPGADLERGPRADWSERRFTIEGDARDRSAVERVLLERYGVLHLRSGAREEGAFHLAIARASPAPWLELALTLPAIANIVSLSVIPAYMPDRWDVVFTLQDPDGRTFSSTGRFEERYFAWLPFCLLNPTRKSERGLERFAAAEALAAEFFRSAEPFVAGQSGASGVAP